MTCTAFGNPKPIVTWLKEGTLLGASGKYQVSVGLLLAAARTPCPLPPTPRDQLAEARGEGTQTSGDWLAPELWEGDACLRVPGHLHLGWLWWAQGWVLSPVSGWP